MGSCENDIVSMLRKARLDEMARTAPLYHTTSIKSAFEILKTNRLKVSDSYGNVSLTRDKRERYGNIQFIINQLKLNQNYRIIPYKDEAEYATGTDSAEEIVNRDIEDLHRYIVEVDITDDFALRVLLKHIAKTDAEDIVGDKVRGPISGIYKLYELLMSLDVDLGDRLKYVFRVLRDKVNA